jgi:hypothetical protein
MAAALFVLCSPVAADTLGGIVQVVRNRGVYFDKTRFPDSVLFGFANTSQRLIGTIGRTKQASVSYALTATYSYVLPSDFYLFHAAILNADPELEPGTEGNQPTRLDYVPIEQYGTIFNYASGRPEQVSVWGDSLILNAYPQTDYDSVTVRYFATPAAVAAAGDTLDLPDAHLPLLEDAIVFLMVDRITFPGRSDRDSALRLTGFLEERLMGRPADEP